MWGSIAREKIVVSIKRGITLSQVPGTGMTLAQRLANSYCVEIESDLPTGTTAVITATSKTVDQMRVDLEKFCHLEEHRIGRVLS